jgi:3-oxoacyl-[acyl-carrier protein] reductase
VIDLHGRACLVTGGSRGIGAAVARLLARCGERVAIGYRADADAAQSVVAEIASGGGAAVAIAADLARPEAAEALVEAAQAAVGPLDVLVANHGIWTPAPILDMTAGDWDRTLASNLTSVAAVCRAAAPASSPSRNRWPPISAFRAAIIRSNRLTRISAR